MRFLRQSVIGFFLAAATLGLLVFAVQLVAGAVQERMAQDSSPPPPRERVFSVNVITAQAGDAIPVLETFGEVQSRRTLELRAAVGGRVIALSDRFEDGGVVRAGEVLVEIDPADMISARDRLLADLADAEAEDRDARRTLSLAQDELKAAEEQAELRLRAYQRQADLLARGVGTAAAVEVTELADSAARQAVLSRRQALAQAEARIDQAATRLARAQIAVDEAIRDLADATLTAPFDGTVSDTSVVEGGLVSANERLAELLDPDDLEVAFRLSTAQYTRLLDDDGRLITAPVQAQLDVTGIDLVAEGRISRASAAAREGQTGRLVFARLEQAAGFKPGDFVTLRISEPELQDVVRLPAAALGPDGQVLVLGDEDRLEAMPVTLLRRQGDDVLVRSDDLPGRDVVTARTPLLGPGIAVSPLRPDRVAASDTPAMIELTEERRAKLIALVEGNARMPEDAKARVLARLAEREVPLQMVERIESRMGG